MSLSLSSFQKKSEKEDALETKKTVSEGLPDLKIEYSDGTNWYTLATEDYVNSLGIPPCLVATTVPLAATYSNGTDGVGATLTSSNPEPFSTDGLNPSVNARVLVKNQANARENGIYVVTVAGNGTTSWVLTRTPGYDHPSEIVVGGVIRVFAGTKNAVSEWMETDPVSQIGVDDIAYSILAKNGVVTGTENQIIIDTSNPQEPIIKLDDNPLLPGLEAVGLPGGSTAQRPSTPIPGMLRFNTGV